MITEETGHGEKIIDDDKAMARLQTYFDALTLAINQNRNPVYTVATVPDATKNRAMMIQVSDEVGGEVPAFSDGSVWRRVTDRAIVS